MVQQTAFTVRNASVVLVSLSAIDPQSIMPEKLSNAKIVPADWMSANGINTPIFALTQYQNGITIRTDGNRCLFQEPIDGNLRESYEIYPIAQRYAAATMLVPYNAVGINWSLEFAIERPELWLREKIIGATPEFSDFLPASLQMAKQLDFAVCNLTFSTENARVVIDFNYHFQLPHSSLDDMSTVLDAWRQCQEHLTESVMPRI